MPSLHDDRIRSLTFPVVSFKRVFDTLPEQEVLTLSELVACFRRFELKPQLHAKIERECERLDRALEQALAGESIGERVGAIHTAGEEARAAGHPREPAMRAKNEELKYLARKEAKKDLRLWSPAKYADGCTERGTEGVTHLSCLVLDYDAGVRIADATAPWADYFHLFHTTWSHRPDHPRFRVILPLAVACPADRFDELWGWAHARAGGDIDKQLSGVASTFALPVVPSADAPRDAGSQPGALLDPRELGIDVGEPLQLPIHHATPSRMLGDPDKEYVVHAADDALYVYDELDEDEMWSLDPRRSSLVDPPLDPKLLASANASFSRGVSTRGATIPPEPPSNPSAVLPSSGTARASAPGAARPVKQSNRKLRRLKKTLVVDFDGVLHRYSSGWTGPTSIPDPPVDGALDFLARAVERFDVAILSSRSRERGGIEAMRAWLGAHGLADEVLGKLRFPRTKPPAHVYLDDRGWRFEGTFPALDAIEAFEPWHKRAPR